MNPVPNPSQIGDLDWLFGALLAKSGVNMRDPRHQHKSDCALHNGPALRPEPCDCGTNPGEQPNETNSEWNGA